MDVEGEDYEDGLTDHPVVVCGVDAFTYETFEVRECALDLSSPPVSSPFDPFVVRHRASFVAARPLAMQPWDFGIVLVRNLTTKATSYPTMPFQFSTQWYTAST